MLPKDLLSLLLYTLLFYKGQGLIGRRISPTSSNEDEKCSIISGKIF